MTAVILIPIIFGVILILVLCVAQSKGGQQKTGNENVSNSYPYRPDVEYRLPNGRITTKGYAAVHPEQFVHWQHGPENVYGENIDRTDWENWRINYYEM